jgi:hypothetical protein
VVTADELAHVLGSKPVDGYPKSLWNPVSCPACALRFANHSCLRLHCMEAHEEAYDSGEHRACWPGAIEAEAQEFERVEVQSTYWEEINDRP